MKIYIHGEKDIPAISSPVYGFAVVSKDLSGLDYDIWLDPAGQNRNTTHNSPRLKVDVDGQRIPYSISSNPRMLLKNRAPIKHEAKILKWISQNAGVLLEHYRRQISDKEILNRVERLK